VQLVYDYDNPPDYPIDRQLTFSFINSIRDGSDPYSSATSSAAARDNELLLGEPVTHRERLGV
jgi:hypothetical protein